MNLNNHGFSKNAIEVLNKRYLVKDKNGDMVETIPQMYERIAKCVSKFEVDKVWESRFYELMISKKFQPNSPMLSGAGTSSNMMACFVLPIYDDMNSIFDAVKHTALIHKSGGGTGFTFSNLRPEGDQVKTTFGIASGPLSFMNIFNVSTETIKQGGKRRGANMGILGIWHPDIERFITVKSKEGRLSNFNLSVSITDSFMEKVCKGDDFDWPLIFDGRVYEIINGLDLWKKIITNAHSLGEPGNIFIDTINRLNPAKDFQTIESTNPCGESPLGPYEACCLGSVDLSKFVISKSNKWDTNLSGVAHTKNCIDWESLANTIQLSVRFLDNVLDINNYPLKQIEEQSKRFRKIGLGTMGWADMLIKLGISYNSPEALELAEKVMKFISETSHEYSEELRAEKGPMGLFEQDPNSEHPLNKRRNSTTTIIAPTGTLSIIAGCSAGIEPIFASEYVKKCLEGEMIVKHPFWEEWEGKDKPAYLIESKDVPIEQHVRMQAAFQKYTDGAVSKTINAPYETTIEEVDKAFKLAWKLGVKGVTFYRDGSRQFQAQTAITSESKPEPIQIGDNLYKDHIIRKMPFTIKTDKEDLILNRVIETPSNFPEGTLNPPEWMIGGRQMMRTGEGTQWIHLFEDPVTGYKEIWSQISKEGRTISSMNAAIGRLGTLALNNGASWEDLEKQLRGIIGEKTTWFNGQQVLSPPDAMAKTIKKRIIDNPEWPVCQHSSKVEQGSCKPQVGGSIPSAGSQNSTHQDDYHGAKETHPLQVNLDVLNNFCPDCASFMIHDEGCKGGRCPNCGWSNCS